MKRFVILTLLILTSCDLKPRYYRPEMDMPDSFRFSCFAQPVDDPFLIANMRWWEQFQDPALNELIAIALANNQDLLLATARVSEFYAKFRIIASQLYPELDFNASYLRQELSNAVNFSPLLPGTRVNSLYTLALSLSYEIDLWGQLRNETEASIARFLGQFENRQNVILNLVSSLASAYVLLLQYDYQWEISKKTYETRLESLKLSQLRFEVGLVSEMEVKQAESEADSALATMKQFEELIPQQEDLISILLGQYPQSIPRGSTLEKLKDPPCVPTGLPSDVLLNRPDILRAELDLVAANAEIGVARAAFFPSITLTGLYGTQTTSIKKIFSNAAKTWNIGINLFQPIFTGWRLTYQLKEAEAIATEALHAYFQTILKAFQEVEDSLIGHEKSQEIVEVLTQRVAALEVYYKLAFLRYDNGQNDYLTVLDAERTLFRAQLDLAESQGNVLINLIGIYKSLGGGWVVDADETFTIPQPCKFFPCPNLEVLP